MAELTRVLRHSQALTHGGNSWIGNAIYFLLVLTPVVGIPVAGGGGPVQPAAAAGPEGGRSPVQPDRHDAELIVAEFAARLQDATDLEAVRTDLAGTVNRALEPVHLSLWSGRR